jgi:hypothetical protein
MVSTKEPAQGKDDPVVFVETPQPVVVSSLSAAMAMAAAEKDASGPPKRVRVVAPYRVCHEGKSFVGGQIVSVPAAKADTWIKAGWVKPVAQKGRK